jgi:G:T-mismatch repair DNA endonuclease (very short patch repair protein)
MNRFKDKPISVKDGLHRIIRHIEELPTCKVCGKQMNIGSYEVKYCSEECRKIGIAKSCEQTCLKKYGCRNPFANESIKEKIKKTNLERYGVEHCSQNEAIHNKVKKTTLEHYGVDCTFKNKEFRESIKKSNLEKYGVECSFQREDVKEKIRLTNIEKRGVPYAMQSNDVKEKSKEACLKKYGVDNVSKVEEVKEKKRKTSIQNWGVDSYYKTEKHRLDFKSRYNEIQTKINKTKKEHKSFASSEIENQLCDFFNENNVKFVQQYRSEAYPFACDFYFCDYDVYVEIQGHWSHGGHAYNVENDKEKLDFWKSKDSKFYENAITTWTIRDVEKRQTAKEHNLKYIEVFSCDFAETIEILKKELKSQFDLTIFDCG